MCLHRQQISDRIVELAQGVHSADPDGGSYSAYGSSDQGIQYSVDGVVINSPEAGETEVDMDFDGLEEVSILGIGAPAQYDGFSGVIVNAVTKSGNQQVQRPLQSLLRRQRLDQLQYRRSGSRAWRRRSHGLQRPLQHRRGPSPGTSCSSSLRSEVPRGVGVAGRPRVCRRSYRLPLPRLLAKINWLPSQKRQSLVSFLEYSDRDSRNIGADDR